MMMVFMVFFVGNKVVGELAIRNTIIMAVICVSSFSVKYLRCIVISSHYRVEQELPLMVCMWFYVSCTC
jgi:hypothetical protein